VELSPERADIHTAEESEFLSDPIVALSVRIVTATLVTANLLLGQYLAVCKRHVGSAQFFKLLPTQPLGALKRPRPVSLCPEEEIVVGTACAGFAVAVEIVAEPSGVAADRLLDDPVIALRLLVMVGSRCPRNSENHVSITYLWRTVRSCEFL